MLIEPEVVFASRVFSPSRLPFKLHKPDVVEAMMEKSVSLPFMVPLMLPELALSVAALVTSSLSRWMPPEEFSHLTVSALTSSKLIEPDLAFDSREEQEACSTWVEPEVVLVSIADLTVALLTLTLPELLCAVRLSHSRLSACTLPEEAFAEKSLQLIPSALTLPELDSIVMLPVDVRLLT